MIQELNKQEKGWIFGKHVLITGASDGIGREIARNLLGICRKLTLVARNKNGKLTELEKELKILRRDLVRRLSLKTEIRIYSTDISDRNRMAHIINKIYEEYNDQIDVFINCAGGSHVCTLFETMNHSDIEEIFDVNAKAPIFWLRELLPRMKNNSIKPGEKKRAHVILISSRSGERALPKLSVYAAAKGAIEKLCEGMRNEYAPYRIAFTLINPGSINTSFTKNWAKEERDKHNAESMSVSEAILPVLHVLNMQIAINKISYESMEQWFNEPGVLKI